MERRSILFGLLAGALAPFLPKPKKAVALSDDVGGRVDARAVPLRAELTSDMFVFEASYALSQLAREQDDSFSLKELSAVIIEPTLCPCVGEHLDHTRVRWSVEQLMADPVGQLRGYYTTHVRPSVDSTRYRAVEVIGVYEKGAPIRDLAWHKFQVGYWDPSPFHTTESALRAVSWRIDPR